MSQERPDNDGTDYGGPRHSYENLEHAEHASHTVRNFISKQFIAILFIANMMAVAYTLLEIRSSERTVQSVTDEFSAANARRGSQIRELNSKLDLLNGRFETLAEQGPGQARRIEELSIEIRSLRDQVQKLSDQYKQQFPDK